MQGVEVQLKAGRGACIGERGTCSLCASYRPAMSIGLGPSLPCGVPRCDTSTGVIKGHAVVCCAVVAGISAYVSYQVVGQFGEGRVSEQFRWFPCWLQTEALTIAPQLFCTAAC